MSSILCGSIEFARVGRMRRGAYVPGALLHHVLLVDLLRHACAPLSTHALPARDVNVYSRRLYTSRQFASYHTGWNWRGVGGCGGGVWRGLVGGAVERLDEMLEAVDHR